MVTMELLDKATDKITLPILFALFTCYLHNLIPLPRSSKNTPNPLNKPSAAP
jgi:hypothetical protein